jgi:hypothetical protein
MAEAAAGLTAKEVATLHADDVRESYKLAFESIKHLTTLNAGSFILIATFLKDIFKQSDGSLNLTSGDKILIGASFLCFALSLVFSTFSMWRLAGLVRSRREYPTKKRKIRWNIVTPCFFYILGLSSFGTAVLANITFGFGEGAARRIVLYVMLALFVIGVASRVGARLHLGITRDKEVDYKVMYPLAEDLGELLIDSTHEGFEPLYYLPVTMFADKPVVDQYPRRSNNSDEPGAR